MNPRVRFAPAIVGACKSPEFRKVFDGNPAWKGYRLPDDFAASAATRP